MTVLVQQVLRYCHVGELNTLIGPAAIYGLMLFLKFPESLANAGGYTVGLVGGFLLNQSRRFVGDRRLVHTIAK